MVARTWLVVVVVGASPSRCGMLGAASRVWSKTCGGGNSWDYDNPTEPTRRQLPELVGGAMRGGEADVEANQDTPKKHPPHVPG